MRTLKELSDQLSARAQTMQIDKTERAAAAGITRGTLRRVLSGSDFKVTTLLAVADKLGLEVLLVPKGAVRGLAPEASLTEPTAPKVKTRVQSALERLKR